MKNDFETASSLVERRVTRGLEACRKSRASRRRKRQKDGPSGGVETQHRPRRATRRRVPGEPCCCRQRKAHDGWRGAGPAELQAFFQGVSGFVPGQALWLDEGERAVLQVAAQPRAGWRDGPRRG